MNTLRKWLGPIASLKLTVFLFALAMFLIFAGTLAQAQDGIITILNRYFRSWIAWIDLRVFLPTGFLPFVRGTFVFPGGFSIGAALMTNLLAAHVVRFKFDSKRIGMFTLHAGLVLLLLGEYITAKFGHESFMTIVTGSSSNYTESSSRYELAVVDPSDPKTDRVIVIPQSLMTHPGAVLHNPLLPFDVTIEEWMPNSSLAMAKEGQRNRANAGAGRSVIATSVPPVPGTDSEHKDTPAAYITLTRLGVSLGTYLVSADRRITPQDVMIENKPWNIDLRPERNYKPYTMTLEEFRHDVFVGTDVPRNFSSRVHLVDPTQNEDRHVTIWMNHPLRYAGETFYQSGFLPGDRGTTLQVVRNPGWLLPYISCSLVALGMLIHFGVVLYGFVGRTLQ